MGDEMNRSAAVAFAVLNLMAHAIADEQTPVTSLQKVLDHPVTSADRMFDGEVYLYVSETAYYFFPRRVNEAEFNDSDIVAMPGRNSESLNLEKYKTGAQLHLRAKIHVDAFCFKPGATCEPFGHFVTLDNPVIVKSKK
jgi:hypothetical protein